MHHALIVSSLAAAYALQHHHDVVGDIFRFGSAISSDRDRLKELDRENRELRRANEILKSASAFFAAELDRQPAR